MRKIYILSIIFIIFITSCSNDSENKKETKDKNLDDKTKIENVISDMYSYANKFEYDKMKKFFVNSSSTQLDSTEIANKYVNTKTKSGTLDKVEVIYVRVEVQNAIVRLNKTFKDGSSYKSSEELIIENNEWKIIYNDEEKDYVPIPEDIDGLWYRSGLAFEIKLENEIMYFRRYEVISYDEKELYYDRIIYSPKNVTDGISGEWLDEDNVDRKITFEKLEDDKVRINDQHNLYKDKKNSIYIGLNIVKDKLIVIQSEEGEEEWEFDEVHWDYSLGGIEEYNEEFEYIEGKGFEEYKKYE